MITFNDSFSKFYQCSIWGFCQEYLFFSICLGEKEKKNPEANFSNLKKVYLQE